MGFTHYFEQKRVFPKRKFAAAVEDCRAVVDAIRRDRNLPLAWEYDEPDRPPAFSADLVRFNGVGDDGHETFAVERERTAREDAGNGPVFDFCKTARKPYDVAVCACLLVFQHHFGDRFRVSSDARPTKEGADQWQLAEWPAAREFVRGVLGYDADLPDGEDIGRMKVGGLPYKKSFFSNEQNIHCLSNGMVVVDLRKYPSGGSNRYFSYPLGGRAKTKRYQVFAKRYPSSDELTLGTFDTLAEAVWFGTAEYVKKRFGAAPDADRFLPDFYLTRDWLSLQVWADKLEEDGHDKWAKKLRKMLPARLAGARV